MLERIKDFSLKHWKLYVLTIFLLVIITYIILPALSEDTTSTVWDGTVANSFSGGSGTQSDPYQINDGSEFAYLIKLINDNTSTFNSYYELTNNINMNNLDFSNETYTSVFGGTLNGNGYTISNFTINNPKTIENNTANNYSIFYSLNGATIENLNIDNVTINITNENSNISLFANESISSTFTNISIRNLNINSAYENNIAGIITNSNGSNKFNNIYIDITSNQSSYALNYLYNDTDTYTNIIIKNNNITAYNNTNVDNIYYMNITNDLVTFDNIDTIELLAKLNNSSNLNWRIKDNSFIITRDSNEIKTYNYEEHSSGISDNILYINDLESDYNYYTGLNYTYNTDGKLPSLENKNIYNSSNLVKVEITYDGKDFNGLQGYVSNSENQDKYVYYKYYVVNDNNTSDTSDDYINIELIDNPFTKRPTDMAFNGWVTDNKDVTISIDMDTYIRYAKVLVNGKNELNVYLHASWIKATVSYLNGSWNNAFNALMDKGMHELPLSEAIYQTYSGDGYYTQEYLYYGDSLNGTYNQSGRDQSGTCRNFWSGCVAYLSQAGTTIDTSNTYYKLNGSRMQQVNNSTEFPTVITGYKTYDYKYAAGLFEKVNINYGSSINNLYDASGNILTGTCTSYNGCTYYNLLDYYDIYNQSDLINENKTYYYLTTRDTNIIVLNQSINSALSSSNNKPFTLTSIYNDNDYTSSAYLNIYIRGGYYSSSAFTLYSDANLENLTIYSSSTSATDDTDPPTTSSSNVIFGNWNNLRIGRGIKTYNSNYINANAIIGGYSGSTGSSSNPTKYSLKVESGIYNLIGVTTGGNNSYYESDIYTNAYAIYGNDYDRITNNNDNLKVSYCASGSWSGNISGKNNTDIAVDTIVKSGSFGTNKYDYAAGIYVGGRNSGSFSSPRRITVEGGYIYNLIGGPLTVEENANYNDTYINIKGGSTDIVIGGAGRTETYGNRIIAITGGTINYSVFGGSNGVEGSNSANSLGTLDGTPYVYIGGNAVIGNTDNVTNNTIETNSKVEAGSVFGIGNGREGYSSIGSANGSNIIIDGNATINRNVYGGGNYGAVGLNNASTTNIIFNNGTINGSIYGGGNNNGSGTSSNTSTININMNNGTVGNIYGGSNVSGTVYGSININALNGDVKTDIYGGGYGSDTFVTDNIDINIGDKTNELLVEGSIYGGSSFGTVNASSTSDASNDKHVNVTINNAKVTGSIFGGAKGSSDYTPYVKGNITVNINNGSIGSVYGGFDQSGKPENKSIVYLNGGTIGSAFGGGNKTDIDNTNIYLRGSTVSKLYGGSNQLGEVKNTNVYIESGTVTSAYGGNNLGGTVENANITLTGGTINTDVYGGGNEASTTNTKLIINGTDNTNITAYGGGASADVTNTNVEVNSDISSVYGGSNLSGTVTTTTVNINKGNITNVYGGNNAGGTSETTNVNINSGVVDSIFGGGNNASSTTTNVNLNDGSVTNIFGGGNEAGADTTNINLVSGLATNVYGGSNKTGDVKTTNIKTSGVSASDNTTTQDGITYDVKTNIKPCESWQDSNYLYSIDVTVTITNNGTNPLNTYNGYIKVPDSRLFSNYSQTLVNVDNNTYSFTEKNQYWGTNPVSANNSYSFNFTILTNTDISTSGLTKYFSALKVSEDNIPDRTYKSGVLQVSNMYGGNNLGGKTTTTNLNINGGTIDMIYGGGNLAEIDDSNVNVNSSNFINIYAGGNQASVNNNTNLNITGGTSLGNVYGGGNQGIVAKDTYVYMTSGNINGSIYAGGKGSTAEVTGNTNIYVSGDSIIGTSECKNLSKCGVYGGGKAAPTGNPTNNNSISSVYIAGGTIYGNVYGGANTSRVYGTTSTSIGADVTLSDKVIKNKITIGGTIFGGGEANEAGSENYDFSFVSVTNGITVNINGEDYDLDIKGSIFGSGNASRTTGTSTVTIKNYGTYDTPKQNISLQRANLVTIDNSHILFKGATDRENDYSSVLFSISRIDELDLTNNSTLYLENNANLLKVFKSLTSSGELAKVDITDEGSVTKNVDNRLYMLEGKNVNIAKNQNVSDYGDVYGMTFFGMYRYKGDGNVNVGMYDKLNTGDTINWSDTFSSGSYVLGAHKTNHDLKVDGFYSNFMQDDNTNKVAYIIPEDQEADYYMWLIGEQIITYEIDLVASKYSTLGTVELPFKEFYKPNTSFNVLGFDSTGLANGVTLTDENDIPRVAESTDIADTKMSLVMKSSNTGFITKGETTFLSDSKFSGTKYYVGENSSNTPSMLFYLYHSKNLGTEGSMGTVLISIMTITKKNDLESDAQRILIRVNLSRALFTTNDYEASITPGREYELFTTTSTNITSKSSFSTYFSLYAENKKVYKDGYKRSLVTNYILPVNTKITMIDLSSDEKKYYYYIVTDEDVTRATSELSTEGDINYYFSNFMLMGTDDGKIKYDDAKANESYYNESTNTSSEEFIFIFDFNDTTIDTSVVDKSMIIELQNSDSQTLISVLGMEASAMLFSIYPDQNAIIDINATSNKNNIYMGEDVTIDSTFTFTQQRNGTNIIFDTEAFDSKLGIKLSLISPTGEVVSGTSLLGLYYEIDGKKYYPNIDGTTRIKLADKVSNYEEWIKIHTGNSKLGTGTYKLRIESYSSIDGIYYGLTPSDTYELDLNIINEIYGLDVNTDEKNLVIDKTTGNSLNNTNEVTYNINYDSGLNNPNIKIKLYRRKYDEIYDTNYELVDLKDYISNDLTSTNTDKMYLLISNPKKENSFTFTYKTNLKTGTYKLEFILYDNDTEIGSVDKYIVIK